MPPVFATYLYRIGRTGRIRPGIAVNFGQSELFDQLAKARGFQNEVIEGKENINVDDYDTTIHEFSEDSIDDVTEMLGQI